MGRNGGWRAATLGTAGVLAAVAAFSFVMAAPSGATDDLGGYQGDKKNVSVDADRNYDGANTTFTFTLTTNGENVSHVLLIACQGIEIVGATGPNGANKEGDAPKNDPSIEGQHNGIKFEPGVPGTYTIVFAGNIAGADFVVKDGPGHKHYPSGQASEVCQPVTPNTPETPNPPSNEPPAENPPSNNPPSNNPSDNNPSDNNPSSNPASNQPSQSGTEVQGSTQTNPAAPSTDVLGASQSQREAQGATLPRTGSESGLLGWLGAMLVAFGSVGIAAGRRR